VSVIVPRRIDKCANSECDEWAIAGEFFCGDECRKASGKRSAKRHIGGSLERRDTGEHDPDGLPLAIERNWRQ